MVSIFTQLNMQVRLTVSPFFFLYLPGGGTFGSIWCWEAMCYWKGRLWHGSEEEGANGGVQEECLPAVGGPQLAGHGNGQSPKTDGFKWEVTSSKKNLSTMVHNKKNEWHKSFALSVFFFLPFHVTRSGGQQNHPQPRIFPPFSPLQFTVQSPPSPLYPQTHSGRRTKQTLPRANSQKQKLAHQN